MLTICLVKLISILLNYIDVRGKATYKVHFTYNFINNNFILFFRSKASLGIQQRLKSRGFSTKFNTGRLRPEVQPLTLLYTIYDRKGPPSVYLLLAMVLLSHT